MLDFEHMTVTNETMTFMKEMLPNWRLWVINKSLIFDNVIYERPQQADPREKKREDQAWHQFRKCDFPVFPEKMEIVRGPNDGKKKEEMLA